MKKKIVSDQRIEWFRECAIRLIKALEFIQVDIYHKKELPEESFSQIKDYVRLIAEMFEEIREARHSEVE